MPSRWLWSSLLLATSASIHQSWLVQAQGPTPTTDFIDDFVRSTGDGFTLGDQPFRYIGTNAYWLQLLNQEDLNRTLSDIAATGATAVRTWAFNDVTSIPEEEDAVWFRAFLPNGTVVVNTGENGLQRLDRIVQTARSVGLRVLFSMTNNWAPNAAHPGVGAILKRQDGSEVNSTTFPRNYLSNDYGGMDTYVNFFAPDTDPDRFHDTFYTDPTILASFKEYVAQVVTRYVDETSVLGYEAANDPRCNSTLPSSTLCSTQTVTSWTGEVAVTIKENDPNHLVATGDAGYYCIECEKVNPLVPPPQTSPIPGKKKRHLQPMTWERLRARRKAREKKRAAEKRTAEDKSLMKRIRGKWFASGAATVKRQANTFGPNYDGTYGVDTEDLINAPGVDFSSFQLFPNQNNYGRVGEDPVDFSNIGDVIDSGVDWIEEHAETANTYGKPSTLTGFGLVSSESANTFAPFNSTQVHNSSVSTTEDQRVSAYEAWIEASVSSGVSGIIHYQWGQQNLSSNAGGVFRPPSSSAGGVGNTPSNSTRVSPNDGYAAYDPALQSVLRFGASLLQNSTTTTPRFGGD